MEPSGDAFNSLVKLDLTSNYPYNPMINSGAIAVASYLMPVVSFEEMPRSFPGSYAWMRKSF